MNYRKAISQHNFTRLKDTSGFPLSPLKKSSDTEIYKIKYVNKPIEHYKDPIKRSKKKLQIIDLLETVEELYKNFALRIKHILKPCKDYKELSLRLDREFNSLFPVTSTKLYHILVKNNQEVFEKRFQSLRRKMNELLNRLFCLSKTKAHPKDNARFMLQFILDEIKSYSI